MQTCLFLMMVFLQRCLHVSTREQGSTGSHAYYAVEIEGDSNVAMALAKQHGIDFIGKIGNMDGHYVFRDPLHLRSRKFLKKKLLQEPKLKWVEWQEFYYRYNRATFPIWSDGTNHDLADLRRNGSRATKIRFILSGQLWMGRGESKSGF
ncbi:PC3-like endoprotease variant B isoform X2 [Narcine bancroftii]|uniref:PC3-like endoprotease variant B isoform X2 n=1 Tax=Narcine bancroftii TaxID=1343680 RepID=UPI003831A6BC